MAEAIKRARRAARQRMSSVLLVPAPRRVDDALRGISRRSATDLAHPPEGSGLRPVRGDFGLPVIGHVVDYIRFGTDFARDSYLRYGPVWWMGGLGTRIATIAGPEAAQIVLTNRDKAFAQSGWTFLIDRFFHRGLMLLDFDEHHTHRRIMQQAFTRDRLAGYVREVHPCVAQSLPTWPTDRPVRLYWALKRLTLDIATQVFMEGRGGTASEQVNQAFVDTVRAASSLVRYPLPGTRWRAGTQGRQVLEEYFTEHLPTARAGGTDLFSALCEATTPDGERFSDDDVINHMIFLMMAAHDTSTITATATAYYLARHPDWQEKAREESLALGDEAPGIEALERLDVLDRVIKESLRLVAPVPLVMRKTVTETDVLGHYLPTNTLVAVALAVNHFVTECWSEPDTFNPDRFTEPGREDHSHRFAWIPFGGGVHKCIGMRFGTLEVKAILHQMLRGYRWSVPPDYRVRWDYTSLPVPVDGLPVRLYSRRGGHQQ